LKIESKQKKKSSKNDSFISQSIKNDSENKLIDNDYNFVFKNYDNEVDKYNVFLKDFENEMLQLSSRIGWGCYS
jgi:hypothetical protein